MTKLLVPALSLLLDELLLGCGCREVLHHVHRRVVSKNVGDDLGVKALLRHDVLWQSLQQLCVEELLTDA